MKVIADRHKSFELEELLEKPLFAHLATVENDLPKDTPCWFHWEDGHLWIIGTPSDTFPNRIKQHPKCSIGIIDFYPYTGLVLHAGFRGTATVERFDETIANKLLSRYLGPNETDWPPRFRQIETVCWLSSSLIQWWLEINLTHYQTTVMFTHFNEPENRQMRSACFYFV